MKLYITPTSPYGRIARIVVREKGLTGRVEVVEARTRTPGSPYYGVVPSGRVPYLERDRGAGGEKLPGLEDSGLICRYLDALDGAPRLHLPPETGDWTYGRLESTARSMLDGIAVLIRELRRPVSEQSPGIIAHETARATRIARQWNDGLVDEPLMNGAINMVQIVLYVALDSLIGRGILDWRPACPALAAWYARMGRSPSIAATA